VAVSASAHPTPLLKLDGLRVAFATPTGPATIVGGLSFILGAGEPQSRAGYERFGLNARQIELIAAAIPKRDYYLQSRHGNRLFQLGLGSIALVLCGTSDPANQKLIDAVLDRHGADGFLRGVLEAKGLDWAAALIDQFPTNEQEITP
jgi:type IV secretion system protein VirB4